MKYTFFVTTILFSILVQAKVDVVDWSQFEAKWREPLCLEEAVYPLDYSKARSIMEQKETSLKTEHNVRRIVNIAYQKNQPTPEILDEIKDILVFKALEAARAPKKNQNKAIRSLKKYAKAAYTVCSRVLNKYPSTRCHEFLLIAIKPGDFRDLMGEHFTAYRASSIYLLDMQNHCRSVNNPDWNCSELAKDYFRKNHLESCVAQQLEPPDKAEPFVNIDPNSI